MKLDKNRIVRTLIQAVSGGAIALVTSICNDFSKEGITASIISFVGTVLTSVLMNIKSQAEGGDDTDAE